MENNLNQSVNFIGNLGSIKDETGDSIKKPLSYQIITNSDEETNRLILDCYKNYDTVKVNLMKECAEKCLLTSQLKIDKLTKKEEACLLSCHYKYLNTFRIGVNVVNSFLNKDQK